MWTHNPLHVRNWYWIQPWANVIASVITFVAVCFVLQLVCGFLTAILISFVATLGLYFLYLDRQIIRTRCPSCRDIIETNVPWLCGYKQCKNENVQAFPFIHECEHCHNIPKAYQCHHQACQKLIHLTHDRQTEFFARQLLKDELVPPPQPVTVDPIAEKIIRQNEAIRNLQHKFKVTRLRSNIKLEETRTITPEEATLFESTLAELEGLYEQQMSKEDAVEHLKEKIREKYKGDETEIERRCAVVDRIMADNL
jgi:hypothetical protein